MGYTARKEVDELLRWVRKAANRPLNVYATGSGHWGLADAETGIPIRHSNGHPIALPNTPSDRRWKQNFIAGVVRAGVIREEILQRAATEAKARDARESLPHLRDEIAQLENRLARKVAERDRLERRAA